MYKKVKKLMSTRGITAYRLSKETGIATSTLTNWKKGFYTPKVDKLKKIADYFGVTLEELISEED